MEITMTEGSFVTHELDEWYPGTLTGIEPADDYGFGPTVRFLITLDGEDEETWALASQKLSPKSKLYGWVAGIDPTNLPETGKKWDYKPLIGRRVEIMFADNEGRERVTKIRAEKKKGDQTPLQKKQAETSAAKKPPARDTSEFANPDEAPF